MLLVDELGKFVEYAALYPMYGDLIALQSLAEHACRPKDARLVLIALLHQNFADYARGVGRTLDEEWHKVASRFEEIPFDEPVERYVQFAIHGLGVDSAILEDQRIQRSSKTIYETARQFNILDLGHEFWQLNALRRPRCIRSTR